MEEQRRYAVLFAATLLCARKLIDTMETRTCGVQCDHEEIAAKGHVGVSGWGLQETLEKGQKRLRPEKLL